MKTLNAIIADDEPLVRERLRLLLATKSWIRIVDECEDGVSTLNAIQQYQPNLLFIDIKMPKGSGFQVIEASKTKHMLIIFVTAHENYALDAFDVGAFDYLVKPISTDRFNRCINRIKLHFQNLDTNQESERITLKHNGRLIPIQLSDISHVQTADNHLIFYQGHNEYKQRMTLKSILDILIQSGFRQVHRSYVINPNFIQDMSSMSKGEYLLRMQNGKVIPTSQSFKNNVKALL